MAQVCIVNDAHTSEKVYSYNQLVVAVYLQKPYGLWGDKSSNPYLLHAHHVSLFSYLKCWQLWVWSWKITKLCLGGILSILQPASVESMPYNVCRVIWFPFSRPYPHPPPWPQHAAYGALYTLNDCIFTQCIGQQAVTRIAAVTELTE